MKQNRSLVLACLFTFVIAGGMIGFCIGKASGKSNVQPSTEYQFNVDMKGYDVYDNGVAIGRLNYGSNPTLDSLIEYDNQ